MAIDAGIYGQVQQPQQINPLASLAQAYQIKGLQAGIEKNDRENDTRNKLLSLVQDPTFASLPAQEKANRLQGIGAIKEAGEIVTTNAAANKDQRAADVSTLDMKIKQLDAAANIAATVKDQESYDRALPLMKELGFDTSKFSPQYNPQGVAQFAQATLSAKDRLAAQTAAAGQAVTMRGQDMTQQTALSMNANTVGVQRDRLDFDKNQPKGQVVQTENGPMMVDPRTGEAKPITAGGVPVQKPGKDIPPNINKSIIENQQNISKIDNAMAAIKAKPGSLNPLFAIPGSETVGQFVDPEGVNARAGVADIGSLILHDRSGAAVTASETPRLKPFIPSAADSPDVALKKLQRFKEIYAQEADLLSQTYSKDQGYKESPLLKGGAAKPATATAPGVISVTNAADYAKVPSGATYTTPDGKMRRKP